MNRYRFVLALFAVVLSFVFVMSCQNSITDNSADSFQDEMASVQLVESTQQYVPGFAKSVNKTIIAANGGVLGGAQTDGNYVDIPADALPGNILFTFSVYVDDAGVLVFDIEGSGYENGHIYLENDLQATIAVNKDWLAEEPDIVVNYDDLTEYFENVSENATHYMIRVDHFSKWSWGILEYRSSHR